VIGRASLSDARGGALVEYLLLVGVVALLAVHAFGLFGSEASTAIHRQGVDLAGLGL
jgi:Flp pilus assembly pilin Flp